MLHVDDANRPSFLLVDLPFWGAIEASYCFQKITPSLGVTTLQAALQQKPVSPLYTETPQLHVSPRKSGVFMGYSMGFSMKKQCFFGMQL